MIVLVGLFLGGLINYLVARQVGSTSLQRPWWHWMPIFNWVMRRDGVAFAVEALAVGMTLFLWQEYGWSAQFVLLLAASLVLIDTAAVDWKVRLIDTLVMLGATLVALACAPLIASSWLSSFLGLLMAAIFFVFLFMLARIMYPQQQAPFGLGDIYLAMFIGALLGVAQVGSALLYGMLLAGVASVLLLLIYGYRRARHMPIAYGSFLCVGVLMYLVLQPV